MPEKYYEGAGITIYHGDFREVMPALDLEPDATAITDPPYNVGYHYATYTDRMDTDEYLALFTRETIGERAVLLHYPEDLFHIAAARGQAPEKCAAWVYNAHTPRKWRMVAWFGCKPDFTKMRQPYKNVTDKRIQRKMAEGAEGSALYDWWHVEQVKNVSSDKTEHPCQIPTGVMRYVVGVTETATIVDPFMGSGTTLRAAKDAGRRAIGIEIDERYCEIAARRLGQEVLL